MTTPEPGTGTGNRGAALRPPPEFLHPERDGKPMGETDQHRRLMIYLIEALELWYQEDPQVYVSGNIRMYYVEGDSNLSISPDVFVVQGIPQGERRVYRLWAEGKGPDVVIEVSSRGTRSEDLGAKFELYRDVLRVQEYYVYDPLREHLPARMRAWARAGDALVDRPVVGGRIASPVLGLELVDVDGALRLYDPRERRFLPGLADAEGARRDAEAARRGAEAARAVEADARRRAGAGVARLRADLDRLRGAPPAAVGAAASGPPDAR